MNWMKIGEFGGFALAAVGTFLGSWCGTRNAAREQVKEEFKRIEETQENGKEEKES